VLFGFCGFCWASVASLCLRCSDTGGSELGKTGVDGATGRYGGNLEATGGDMFRIKKSNLDKECREE